MKRIASLFLAMITILSISFSVSAETIDDPQTPPSQTVDLSECNITLSKTEYPYFAKARTPIVTVEFGGITFKKETDYTVSYLNNINAGKAKAVITAVNGSTVLTGKVTKEFTINKKDISSFGTKVISQSEYVYSGKENKPMLSFSNSEFSAEYGKDYTLTYKNNIYTGIATVTAKGKGNYTGTYQKTFYIKPAKVSGLKVKKLTDTTFTLSWNSVSGNISGYRLYRYNFSNKKWDLAVATKNNYFNVSGRTPATTYKYMVRAYKKVGEKLILSDVTNGKTVVMKPSKVETLASAYSGKYFKFKWQKVSGSSGYEIQYSKDKNLKKNVKTVKVNSGKTTAKSIKLSSKQDYYYRIRAYKLVNGKKLYGAWSVKKKTRFSNVYSSFKTYFSSPAGRTTNIKKACEYIDGTVLSPGETFSFNEIVGRRTPERGFKVATVYSGQSVVEGYGGGVCQVSTTIFNAALLANLQIVERYQHTMKVHYVDPGRDAAISWGTNDLKFKNSTNYDIKISAKVYNNSTIEIKLLTNSSAKPKKVKLSVSSSYYSGSQTRYTLKRSVGGKVNYQTSSCY